MYKTLPIQSCICFNLTVYKMQYIAHDCLQTPLRELQEPCRHRETARCYCEISIDTECAGSCFRLILEEVSHAYVPKC